MKNETSVMNGVIIIECSLVQKYWEKYLNGL